MFTASRSYNRVKGIWTELIKYRLSNPFVFLAMYIVLNEFVFYFPFIVLLPFYIFVHLQYCPFLKESVFLLAQKPWWCLFWFASPLWTCLCTYHMHAHLMRAQTSVLFVSVICLQRKSNVRYLLINGSIYQEVYFKM